MQQKQQVMSTEGQKPGFVYPPIARQYGFMNPTDTMQAGTCQCPSFSSGFSYGVGLAVGLGAVTAVTVGILKMVKK